VEPGRARAAHQPHLPARTEGADRRLQPGQPELHRIEDLFDGDRDEIRFDHSGSFLSTLAKVVEPVSLPELPESDEGIGEDDVASEREVDEVVAASDESQDEPRDSSEWSAPVPGRPGGAPAAHLPVAADVQRLFSRLEIVPTERGGMRIEAPPEVAATLASILEGLAGMLRQGAAEDPVSEETSA
jgi:hypothetical protein